MPKYMIHGSYTVDGLKGVMKDGGTGRKDAVKKLAETSGGSLESIYFALGNEDVYVVVDLPDNETAVAVAAAVISSGAVHVQTTVLLTPEQVDAAMKKTVTYRRPGG